MLGKYINSYVGPYFNFAYTIKFAGNNLGKS